jgi:hypothetical protein
LANAFTKLKVQWSFYEVLLTQGTKDAIFHWELGEAKDNEKEQSDEFP